MSYSSIFQLHYPEVEVLEIIIKKLVLIWYTFSAENEKLRWCHRFLPSLRRAEPVTAYSHGPPQQARTRNLPRTGQPLRPLHSQPFQTWHGGGYHISQGPVENWKPPYSVVNDINKTHKICLCVWYSMPLFVYFLLHCIEEIFPMEGQGLSSPQLLKLAPVTL